ncbi:hypothetical GPI-anchored protein, conserved [Candida dubliniensis CD36]|uniref:Hypothetical GPI-anchored protein, conserved n=1 Tax=Candida dubliniensis (strain CD36 / ATCC MYA-646 / CBS 7987 / NCPF 3949 / NRRL Y-17841) TaxID=573826 RepID=B9WJ87_CANDC|nr:hypothetical GPI-anchored protein, conserved [Candida dubliniensis CD36]CAX41308.1 hypothetical GPI-anchored protein, conserved [Candida dubliniensis CD36]
MKSGLLFAVILPVAFAVKKDQQSCNSSCIKVLQKQQESCPSGSDTNCLCDLSDSDYWEPLADCDCINPDKKFSASELKIQICGGTSSSSSATTTTTSSSTEAETTEQPSSTSSSSSVQSSETTILETPSIQELDAESTSSLIAPLTESAVAAVANTDTNTLIEPQNTETTPQEAPLIQPQLNNGSDWSQVSVQAFENNAGRTVVIGSGSLLALLLNFI